MPDHDITGTIEPLSPLSDAITAADPLPGPTSSTSSDAHIATERALLAARFVNSTARHVFLTGKAGTGKTTFLHKLAAGTHKRYAILAPTGIAALNAGGVTVHSQFQLPFGSYVPEKELPAEVDAYGAFVDRRTLSARHPMNGKRRGFLRELDLLVIDEVSMLRADLLDAIDHRMRSVKDFRKPFGGVQLLLIGDLYQLPPVVKDHEMNVMRRWYPSLHFFESRALREDGYVHVELDRIFRQKDPVFVDLLNNFRNNTVTTADVERLNAHYRPFAGSEERGIITLTTHNAKADAINEAELRKLPGETHAFDAEVTGEFPESMFPVQRRVELKEGARIMFTKNDQHKAYFNGKLATVKRIDGDRIDVLMDTDTGGSAEPYTLKREIWENKRYTIDAATREQQDEIIGTFAHLPVKLAWAITVHKSQGLTFDRAIIDVGNAFAPGQVYVALSRLRTLDGLILRTRIDPSVVSTDRDVVAFHERGDRQEPLPDQLKQRQADYLRALLNDTFDFGPIVQRAAYTQKDHNEKGEFEDESMKSALTVLMERLRAEEENTRKFRTQLLRLLAEEKRDELAQRLEKGAAYYADFLLQQVRHILQHLALVEQLARTKQYANALREIDSMLGKKLEEIAKVAYLAHCIITGAEIERQDKRLDALKQQRLRIIEELRGWMQEHHPDTTHKTGRVRKRAADDDDVFSTRERKPRGRKKPKGETYTITFTMLKEGLTLEEIAKQRSLSVGTIEGHAARGIEAGEVDISKVMKNDHRDMIADWMRASPDLGLNAAQQHFEGHFTYGQLRMVQAWLKKGE